jgi:hypothetical protein
MALPASAPAQREGGTLVALVLDAGAGRLLVTSVAGGSGGDIPVPRAATSVAATAFPRVAVVVSRHGATLVDVRAMRVVAVLRGFGAACDVALSREAAYAYVTDEVRGELAVVDVGARRIVRRVAVGGRPCRLAVTNDEVWIADAAGKRRLTVLDARHPARPRLAARVDAGGPVLRLAVAQRPSMGELSVGRPRHLWITYRGSGRLGKLDTEARRIVFLEPVGSGLGALAVDPSEHHAWVVDDAADRLLVVDAASGRVLRRIAVGRGVSGIAALVGRAVLVKRDGTLAAYYDDPRDFLGREWTSRRLGGRLTAVALAFS